jgi:hypothetical protein
MSIYFNAYTVPHSEQRYDSAGDWRIMAAEHDPYVALVVHVSDLKDWRMEFLVAAHELIEAVLCKHRGITQAEVDAFDMAHLDAIEPGILADAPYRQEHIVACEIEERLARELEVDWIEYTRRINALSEEELK